MPKHVDHSYSFFQPKSSSVVTLGQSLTSPHGQPTPVPKHIHTISGYHDPFLHLLSHGVVAEWSNAIDSKSIPFGGACSNHAHVDIFALPVQTTGLGDQLLLVRH